MIYAYCQILFKGILSPIVLEIDFSSGRLEVLFTSAVLIDWLRAQGNFLEWGNNGLGRSIAHRAYGLGAVRNRQDVPHMGTNTTSPMTSAEFRISWTNFIQLLTML
jgi:hypothetical protein